MIIFKITLFIALVTIFIWLFRTLLILINIIDRHNVKINEPNSCDLSLSGVSRFYPAQIIIDFSADINVQQKSVTDWEDNLKKYLVDLVSRTCTCDSFTKRRSGFSEKDVRRFCTHMIHLAGQRDGLKALGSLELAAIEGVSLFGGAPIKERLVRTTLASGMIVYFALSAHDPWIDVYARTRRKGERAGNYTGNYHRYGFNRDRSGWSYGDGPPAAREIRELIKQIDRR